MIDDGNIAVKERDVAQSRAMFFLDNRTYRTATGVDSRVATAELQDFPLAKDGQRDALAIGEPVLS
jgi:hypothetical protein